jgi:hypothetical protein
MRPRIVHKKILPLIYILYFCCCASLRTHLQCAALRGPHALPSRTTLGHGTVWNLSCTGWRLSGDLPMRPEETLSLTITLSNEQRIEVPEAVARWSRGSGAHAPSIPK